MKQAGQTMVRVARQSAARTGPSLRPLATRSGPLMDPVRDNLRDNITGTMRTHLPPSTPSFDTGVARFSSSAEVERPGREMEHPIEETPAPKDVGAGEAHLVLDKDLGKAGALFSAKALVYCRALVLTTEIEGTKATLLIHYEGRNESDILTSAEQQLGQKPGSLTWSLSAVHQGPERDVPQTDHVSSGRDMDALSIDLLSNFGLGESQYFAAVKKGSEAETEFAQSDSFLGRMMEWGSMTKDSQMHVKPGEPVLTSGGRPSRSGDMTKHLTSKRT